MKYLFIYIIKFYRRFLSPVLPASCRFYPTCSEYSLEAFQKYGFFKGFWLATYRVIRCNPFNKGGYDPLPENYKFTLPRILKTKTNNRNIRHYE
ncbi:MAG: membrane protein insertion efficiency factor YidD [bacterium]